MEGTGKDLDTLPRQQRRGLARQQGRERKWEEEEEEKTRIELHPASCAPVCVSVFELTFTISQSKHTVLTQQHKDDAGTMYKISFYKKY